MPIVPARIAQSLGIDAWLFAAAGRPVPGGEAGSAASANTGRVTEFSCPPKADALEGDVMFGAAEHRGFLRLQIATSKLVTFLREERSRFAG
jgi:hypothetical protein